MAPIAVEPQSAPEASPALPSLKKAAASEPRVRSFPAATVTTEQLKDAIRNDGVVFLKNLIAKEDMLKINEELTPYFGDDTAWEGTCFPPQTLRVNTLPAKSETWRKKVTMNELWLKLIRETLTLNHPSWFGPIQAEGESKPIVSGSVLFRIAPGAASQGMHRDGMIHHIDNPRCTEEEYTFDREPAIHLFIAGTKTTKENGATRVIPKSHLEKTTDGPGKEEDVVYCEMEVGDAAIMSTSLWHAGSANNSKEDIRMMYSAYMCRGTLRTFENHYLSIKPEQAATWTDEELEVMGYNVSHPFLGGVNFVDPVVAIRGLKEGKRYDITDGKVLNKLAPAEQEILV